MLSEVGTLGKELKRNREKHKHYASVSSNMIGTNKKEHFFQVFEGEKMGEDLQEKVGYN